MKNTVTILHPIYGEIRLNQKFQEVLRLEYFQELYFKKHLGLTSLSKTFANAMHTRILHALGTMEATRIAISKSTEIFHWLKVTKHQKEVFLYAALSHDLGHLAFSHGLDGFSPKSHEERTIERLREYSEIVDNIFGFNITEQTIDLFEKNLKIKQSGKSVALDMDLNIYTIFDSLLIGSIDCDRIDYLATDILNIKGERKNFVKIFDDLNIILSGETPILGYNAKTLPNIVDLLLTRSEMFKNVHYSTETFMRELYLQKYLHSKELTEEEVEKMSEEFILEDLRTSVDSKVLDPKVKRLASVVLNSFDEFIFHKTFDNMEDYNIFVKRLYLITGSICNTDYILTDCRKISVYNPKKNAINIIYDNGIVKDLSETEYSDIVCKTIQKNYVIVDIHPSHNIDENIVTQIRSLFENDKVEITKRFTTSFEVNPQDEIMDWVQNQKKVKVLQDWSNVHISDTYFKPYEELDKLVFFRYRKISSGDYYSMQIPIEDISAVSKCQLYTFDADIDFVEYEQLTKSILEKHNISFSNNFQLYPFYNFNIERSKMMVKFHGTTIKISLNESTCFNNEFSTFSETYIECKLIEGDQVVLFNFAKSLEQGLGLTETTTSKLARAEEYFSSH